MGIFGRKQYDTSSIDKDDLEIQLEKYDNSSPKMDELKFIDELCKKYSCTRDNLLHAIRIIRRSKRNR